MKTLCALFIACLALPARADVFVVDGLFHAEAGLPENTLSGTINITGGQITSASLSVPGFALPFTNILFNQYFNGGWILSAYDATSTGQNQNYLTFNFMPFPGPYLIGFEQGRITNGTVDHYEYNPITTVGSITYYGLALGGTICPVDGCAPFPVSVPGPVIGAGWPGVIALVAFMTWWRKRKCRTLFGVYRPARK